MKIAIHHRPGSYSEQWIEYCNKKNIPYKIVNAYDSDIIKQVEDCDAFMWHYHHSIFADTLFAKQLIFSLQVAGKKVFPNFYTGWHFDDKVGEKYMLESIDAPIVPSYVFYSKEDALNWVNKTSFPKVFKLRCGAGSSNVKLVHSRSEAKKLINRAFGHGFSQHDRWGAFIDRIKVYRSGYKPFIHVIKGFVRFLFPIAELKMYSKEKRYVYFQDFIPDNTTDFRIKVVNGNCWGFQRMVRKNDFRASGSGQLLFDKEQIPEDMIKIALSVSEKLSLQSVAYDFVIDKKNNRYLIVETSYCFGMDEEEMDNGYWDKNLNWHSEKFDPRYWMVESIL